MARNRSGNLVAPAATYGETGLVPAEHQQQPEFDPGNIGEDMPDDLALAETLAQLGDDEGNAKVFVYRVNDKTKKDEFAYETSASEFAIGGLTEISRRYGGGEYRIRVYLNGRVVTHKRVSILDPKEPEKIVPTGPQLGDFQAMFAQQHNAMLEGFKMLAESLKAPMQPQQNRMEILQEMAMLKNLFGDKQQSEPPINAMLDMLQKGIEMGRSSGEQSTMDVLMRGLEMLGPKILEAASAPQGVTVPVPHTPQPALAAIPQPPAPQPAPQPSETPDMKTIREMMLKNALNFLVSQARRNGDPVIYASLVLDQLSDEDLSQLLDRADWLDFLASHVPAIKEPPIAAWFVALRTEIQQLLTEEPDSGIDQGHADTNAPQPHVNPDGNSTGEAGNG